ncbi:MAG TPA: cation-translocating P-type ATPase [Candidatus Borkfalkia excrementipullorum]|nr:cation-translocating P-type ATPase [Candidatus Borkfalkia excrementipullorum]
MRAYHSLPAEAVLSELQTSELGLGESLAAERLEKFGENTLRTKKRAGALRLFLSQFKDFMTILLICAAAISAVIAYITGDAHELADTGILLFIIFLNTFVGFIQQYRADNAIEKLKSLSVCRVKTVRGGKDLLLDSALLVPGDVIDLEEGDMVPADCRVLRAEELKCDESALTGESVGVTKNAGTCAENTGIFERKNMLYSSSFVVKGQAKAVVVRTGKDTEIGKIADLLENTETAKTPLEKILAVLGKVITVFVISVAAIIFVFGIFFKESTLLGNFMSSVAIAVAAIPEGMPAIVTVIMALGVQKMSRERAIVRKLHAVETLGGCSCICSDKTGTLTENRMTVEEVVADFSGEPVRARLTNAAQGGERKLLECMAICNTVKGTAGRRMGDPTEIALVNFTDSLGFSCENTRLGGIPFTSERKMMSVAARTAEGSYCFVKGGCDVVLSRCTRIWSGGAVRPLTEADRRNVSAAAHNLACRALRVLGFACREYTGAPREDELIFLGVCGMIDPPKQGVKEAVAECKAAGITPVMITGDHRDTAYAIAARLGIAERESDVLTGAELDGMSGAELAARVPEKRVFARVSPKHKSMIVEQFQRAGEVVAMTGDGINDAPGIRKADIGIAMGISGTDVTKSAADMVIADDNFSTIVTAVREGRHVFSNIKKTIQFFLATNLAEVLSILIVTLALYKFDFLTSTQLLWINLITDSLPVLSLGAEQAERDVMLRPPVHASSLFSRDSMAAVVFYGVVQTAICVGIFVWSANAYGNAVAVTMTFFVLSFLELFHSFNIRSERGSAFGKGFFSNRMLFLTVFIGIAVNLLLCPLAPVRDAFGIVLLSPAQWGVVFASSLAVIPAAEIYKAVWRLIEKRGKQKGARVSGARGGRGVRRKKAAETAA